MYLEKINAPEDVKKLNIDEMHALAAEMRKALLFRLSKHGGHFGPNFGMVEATIAMHYVFDSPKDQIVYDVSHQSYPHKMLTGRKDAYLYEEHFDDVSGYTNPEESEHDFFNVGHTSTSISLASGLAKARDLNGGTGNVIAVIGDGSLSGGEALEGLDFAGEMDTNFIIVVNDNDMSIAENHGGLYRNLKLLRDTDGKAECNLFRAMGLDYVFVKDGNDISSLIAAFRQVKDSTRPVVVHIVTQKGKGYELAEQHKEQWHWCMPFDPATGKPTSSFDSDGDYGTFTANYLQEKMAADPSVCAITSATPAVFGFTPEIREKAGKQFVDVGIAEEQAVAMISGMAKGGLRPVWTVFSTFIQRTYDQIAQDLCINANPAVINVTWGGTASMNDITHICLFDIPMLCSIPGLIYLAPTTCEEYFAMLRWAILQDKKPIAIRIPSNGVHHTTETIDREYAYEAKYKVIQKGEKVAIIAAGSFYQKGENVVRLLAEKGIKATLVNPRYLNEVDRETLDSLKGSHELVVTLEDGSKDGGFGERIAAYYGTSEMKVLVGGIKKDLYDRFDLQQLLSDNHLLDEQIVEDVIDILS